jgi:hypothetical protein
MSVAALLRGRAIGVMPIASAAIAITSTFVDVKKHLNAFLDRYAKTVAVGASMNRCLSRQARKTRWLAAAMSSSLTS